MKMRFRACTLDQPYLMPPSLQDWLPADHLARFIAEVCEQLDLSAILAAYQRRDGRGAEAYHPLLLTRLLLYAYCVGKPSSRQIEKATHDDVAFRYLAGDQHPDHDTIASFRQQHLEALAGLFVEALALCREAGLVKLGHVALDGTKIQAQASRGKNWKGGQLLQKEQELEQRVQQLLAEAARVDAAEDSAHGKGRRGDELPKELATAEKRLAKLREVKQRMEEQARRQAEELARQREAAGGKPRNEVEKKRWQRAKKRSEVAAQQYNATDGDSQLMKDGASGAMVQAFNAQAMVDEQSQIIVAADVVNEPNDKAQLVPMIEQMLERNGSAVAVVTADTGYWSEEALGSPVLEGITVYVPPDSPKTMRKGEPLARNAPRGERARQMRERFKDEAVKAQYGKRGAVVEPVFGQIKESRGFRRFLLRGLAKVKAEWMLICLTHNLLKLHRARLKKALNEGADRATLAFYLFFARFLRRYAI